MYDILDLNKKLVTELKEIANGLDIDKYEALKKDDLIYKILDQQAINPPKHSPNEDGRSSHQNTSTSKDVSSPEKTLQKTESTSAKSPDSPPSP